MSKRFGNITTARDLREDGVDAGAVRLLMFQVHYRQQLDLTDEALASAREGSRRLGEFQNRLLRRRRSEPTRRAFVEAADAARAGSHRGARRRPQRAARGRPRCSSFASAGNAALDAGERAGPRASPPGVGPKACWA